MDQDEEEEDFGEEDEEEEEEEEDIFTRDKKKIFGDTSHYCPVMLKDKSVLWPGIAECAAKYRERTYFFSSTEARATFLANPTSYLPIDRPLEVSSGFCWLFVFALKNSVERANVFFFLFFILLLTHRRCTTGNYSLPTQRAFRLGLSGVTYSLCNHFYLFSLHQFVL